MRAIGGQYEYSSSAEYQIGRPRTLCAAGGADAVGAGRCARLGFFGRRLVGLMLDGSHHGKGEHDERDVTMPAVPGSGFVVVEPELVFGCLEAILDRPAMALDADQGLDRSPCWTLVRPEASTQSPSRPSRRQCSL